MSFHRLLQRRDIMPRRHHLYPMEAEHLLRIWKAWVLRQQQERWVLAELEEWERGEEFDAAWARGCLLLVMLAGPVKQDKHHQSKSCTTWSVASRSSFIRSS